MLKIAVFGFYNLDQTRIALPGAAWSHLSPVSTEGFMRAVWEMEPSETRIGRAQEAVVRLTTVGKQPVYVQSLSDQMAHGAGLLRCDGYIVIMDAVKILAPKAIQVALGRLHELQPNADVIIAAGRQNEPEALSCEEIQEVLGLHPDLLVMPYVPSEPKTVQRLIRRMVRYVENPDRVPPPIFAGETPAPSAPLAPPMPEHPEPAPTSAAPRIHGVETVWLAVSDLKRALRFYQGLLGFRLLGQIDLPASTLAHLDAGRGGLFLVAGDEAAPAENDAGERLPHLTLRVSGLDAIVERLAREGVAVVRAPVQTVYVLRAAVVADPDGNRIELVEGDVIYSRR